MAGIFRGVAVLGILWTLFFAYLLIAIQDSFLFGAIYALIVLGVLLPIFGRLYALRRWAAAATCLYFTYTAVTSPSSGIWQWVFTWVVIAASFGMMTWRCWRALRSGW